MQYDLPKCLIPFPMDNTNTNQVNTDTASVPIDFSVF